jgi:hypothetical protein
MARALDEVQHLGGSVEGQRMTGEARPRRNVDRHVPHRLTLCVRRLRQEREHQVFQRDHTNLELHEF